MRSNRLSYGCTIFQGIAESSTLSASRCLPAEALAQAGERCAPCLKLRVQILGKFYSIVKIYQDGEFDKTAFAVKIIIKEEL